MIWIGDDGGGDSGVMVVVVVVGEDRLSRECVCMHYLF